MKGANQPEHMRTFVIRLLESIIFKLTIYVQNFNFLACLCSPAGWFGYDLVGNAEYRLSALRPIYEPIHEILVVSTSANSLGSESLHTRTVLPEPLMPAYTKNIKAQTKTVISSPTRYQCMPTSVVC